MLLATLALLVLASLPGLLRVLVARLGEMTLHEVSLGVGPVLWRRGSFRLRAIPVGLFALIEAGAAGAALVLVLGILGLLSSTARWFGMVCPACGSRECGSSAPGAYGCVACGSVWKISRA